MAKIIYAVAGEGFGHSSRSHLIGQRLLDSGHDVMFAGSNNSLKYLKQYFDERVREVFGLTFVYNNSKISNIRTLKKNIFKIPEMKRINNQLFKDYYKPFQPDLVISDFEPFSAWWALKNGIPFISIDHEHMVNLCELEHKLKNFFARFTAEFVAESYYVGAASYIIINFFKTGLKIDTAVLAPPVVRPMLLDIVPSNGDHIVYYTTSSQDKQKLCDCFSSFADQKIIIYGFNEDDRINNCIFKKRSTDGFLADLASSRGVIASAGFSLLSECLYFGKKMFLIPIGGQYEQIINCHYIKELGLGVFRNKIDKESIAEFLENLQQPLPEDDNIIWPDNNKFFEILQSQLNKLPKPVQIKME